MGRQTTPTAATRIASDVNTSRDFLLTMQLAMWWILGLRPLTLHTDEDGFVDTESVLQTIEADGHSIPIVQKSL